MPLVASPHFGYTDKGLPRLQDENCALNQVLQKVKPMGSIAAQQMLREAYDVTFGIYDHLGAARLESNPLTAPDAKRPLALVALHPAEDWAGQHTTLEYIMRSFADNQVGEIFKISIFEFLDAPVEYAHRLMRIAKKVVESKSSMMAGVNQELKQLQDGK